MRESPARPLPAALMFFAALTLAACQPPANVKQLQDQNQALQGRLDEAGSEIDRLKAQEVLLRKDVAELNRVVGVLGLEKGTREQESTQLRGLVRSYMQEQIDRIKAFLVKGDLLDYVGGELLERANSEPGPLTIVDLAHVMPKGGTLTAVGGHFAVPASFQVKVLRPIGEDLVVIWESKPFAIPTPGRHKVQFPVTVGVEKGDVIAYHFPAAVGVGFDEGTGDTRYLRNEVRLGARIGVSSLQGAAKKRAYSIGVYGLLN